MTTKETTFLFVHSIFGKACSFGVIDRGTIGFVFAFNLMTKWREFFKNGCHLRRICFGFTLLRQAISLKKLTPLFQPMRSESNNREHTPVFRLLIGSLDRHYPFVIGQSSEYFGFTTLH